MKRLFTLEAPNLASFCLTTACFARPDPEIWSALQRVWLPNTLREADRAFSNILTWEIHASDCPASVPSFEQYFSMEVQRVPVRVTELLVHLDEDDLQFEGKGLAELSRLTRLERLEFPCPNTADDVKFACWSSLAPLNRLQQLVISPDLTIVLPAVPMDLSGMRSLHLLSAKSLVLPYALLCAPFALMLALRRSQGERG